MRSSGWSDQHPYQVTTYITLGIVITLILLIFVNIILPIDSSEEYIKQYFMISGIIGTVIYAAAMTWTYFNEQRLNEEYFKMYGTPFKYLDD